MAEPRYTDALTHAKPLDASPDCVDPADDLVAWNDWHLRVRQLAIHHMQVRTAGSASGHLHSNLALLGVSIGNFGPFKSSAELL